MLLILLFFVVSTCNLMIANKIFNRKRKISNFYISIFSTLAFIGIPLSNDIIFYTMSVLMTAFYAMTLYYTSVYGPFSYGSIASILESNVGESKEFIYNIDKKHFSVSILLSLAYFMAYIGLNSINISNVYLQYISYGIIFLSVISFFCIVLLEKKIKPLISLVKYNVVINVFLHVGRYLRYKRKLKNNPIKSEWTNIKCNSKDTNYFIVVIGESARKSNFHFYGYPYITTPKIDQMKGYSIVHQPFSPATQTMLSIPRLLCLNSYNDNLNSNLNILDLARDAGLETYWFSNQGKLGSADTEVTRLANRAEFKHFLQADYSSAGSDFNLLELLGDTIKNSNPKKSKLIFLHTMGSHSDFGERSRLGRYNLDDSTPTYDYDNTIYNTYKLIEDIRTILANNSKSYNICYFSDHGLTEIEKEPYYTHSVGNLFNYSSSEVPLLFIDDEDHSDSRFINKKYYLRDMVHTFADWMNISASEIDYRKSILSSLFKDQEEYILDDAMNVVKPIGVDCKNDK